MFRLHVSISLALAVLAGSCAVRPKTGTELLADEPNAPLEVVLQAHEPNARMAFAADGRWLITVSGSVAIWDVRTGLQAYSVAGYTFDLDRTGRYMAVRDAKRILRVDLHTLKPAGELAIEALYEPIAMSPDGESVAYEARNVSGLYRYDFDRKKVKHLAPYRADVKQMAWLPDGPLLVSWGSRFNQQLIDSDGDDADEEEYHVTMGGSRFVLTRDAQAVLIDDGPPLKDGISVFRRDPGAGTKRFGERLVSVASPEPINAARLSMDAQGRFVAHDSIHGPLYIWDLKAGRLLHKLPMDVGSLAMSPDGQRLYVVPGRKPEGGAIIDVQSGQVVRRLDGFRQLALSPDGSVLAMRAPDAALLLVSTATGVTLAQNASTLEARRVLVHPDGRRLVVASGDTSVALWDLASARARWVSHLVPPGTNDAVLSLGVSPDGTRVVAGTHDGEAIVLDIESGRELARISVPQEKPFGFMIDKRPQVVAVALSPDNSRLGVGLWRGPVGPTSKIPHQRWEALEVYDLASGARRVVVEEGIPYRDHLRDMKNLIERAEQLAFSADGRTLVVARAVPRRFPLEPGADVTSPAAAPLLSGDPNDELEERRGSVVPSVDGRLRFRVGDGPALRVSRAADGQEVASLFADHGGGSLALTPDHFYASGKAGLSFVALRRGLRVFPVQQFDLTLNRPDVVVDRLGMAPERVALLKRARERRLAKLGVDPASLTLDMALPQLVLTSPPPPRTTKDRTLALRFAARDDGAGLARYHVIVNDVPILGTAGKPLSASPGKTVEQDVTVDLTHGFNKIQLAVVNTHGAESLRETVVIESEAAAEKPDLYALLVGVSDYQDDDYDLSFAAKDADDLGRFFEGAAGRYGALHVKRLLNAEATRAALLDARGFFATSKPDDEAVVFVAGHGLLDDLYDYYFAPTDMRFEAPRDSGVSYEAIESLLDGIGARRKLLLMDTCYSGEVDDEERALLASVPNAPGGTIKARMAKPRGFATRRRARPALGVKGLSEVLAETFADLRRGTGTVVISSAGGAEYALESPEWQNGVFTYSVLAGLRSEADRNHDGSVRVSELRDHVIEQVGKLTSGKQRPTARRDALEVDFPVY